MKHALNYQYRALIGGLRLLKMPPSQLKLHHHADYIGLVRALKYRAPAPSVQGMLNNRGWPENSAHNSDMLS